MRVGTIGRGTSLSKASGARSTGSAGLFSRILETAAGTSTAAAAALAPTGAVAALVGLQDVGSATDGTRRRRAISRGERLLDGLETLRVDLLAGRVPPSRLRELARLLDEDREVGGDGPDDVALSTLLDDIALRVAVELAKFEAAAARAGQLP